MSYHQEPPGCKPKTHWEKRCIAMEWAIQDLIILIGHHVPESREEIVKWCEDWTKARDTLRREDRNDKN